MSKLVTDTIADSINSYLAKLVQFDTQNPPRNLTAQSEVFAYLSSLLDNEFAISIIDHGLGRVTFYAVRGTPSLIFNVHIDTVPIVEGWQSNPHELSIDTKSMKAIGLGACDIKAAAACLLALAGYDKRDLALLFTTDEEGANGHCVQAFVESEQATQYTQAIIAEPTQCKAVIEHSGFVSVHGDFKGYAGHSSDLAALAKNAIHAASQWAAKALNFVTVEYANNTKSRFNIGMFKGGVKSNITASEAKVIWSARLEPGSDTHKFVTDIKECVNDSADVIWKDSFFGEALPNASFSNESAHVFSKKHQLETGAPVGFWTEAAIFHQARIPAIVLGPGDIAQAHTANEWIELEQLSMAFRLYERVSR